MADLSALKFAIDHLKGYSVALGEDAATELATLQNEIITKDAFLKNSDLEIEHLRTELEDLHRELKIEQHLRENSEKSYNFVYLMNQKLRAEIENALVVIEPFAEECEEQVSDEWPDNQKEEFYMNIGFFRSAVNWRKTYLANLKENALADQIADAKREARFGESL